jgi:hypothetical protein
MKLTKLVYSFFFLPFILLFFSCSTDEKTIISDTFERYKTAIIKNNIAEAANFLDQKTLDFYKKLTDMALNADSAQVGRLSFYNKLTVLHLRQTLSKQALIAGKLNPKKIFIQTYKKDTGSVAAFSKLKTSIIRIKQKDNSKVADVWLGTDESEDKFPIKFKFEEGSWKINYATMFNWLNRQLTNSVKYMDIMSEVELLKLIIEDTSGEKMRTDIWKPILKPKEL